MRKSATVADLEDAREGGAGAAVPLPLTDAVAVGGLLGVNLDQLAAGEPLAAPGARRALGLGDGGGVDVLASLLPPPVVPALARLAAAERDLVDGCSVAHGGDEPHATLEAYLRGVLAPEGEAALLAGGWGRRLR